MLSGLEDELSGLSEGAGHVPGKPPGSMGVSSVSAAFQVVTPSGGCSSLPANLVCRFSGATGTCSALNGQSVSLSWNGTSWSGTFGVNPNVSTVSLICALGAWKLAISGHYVVSSPATLTGTSGPSPNLTGTATLTTGCAGNVTTTVTRT
jgi:hypothetical protein